MTQMSNSEILLKKLHSVDNKFSEFYEAVEGVKNAWLKLFQRLSEAEQKLADLCTFLSDHQKNFSELKNGFHEIKPGWKNIKLEYQNDKNSIETALSSLSIQKLEMEKIQQAIDSAFSNLDQKINAKIEAFSDRLIELVESGKQQEKRINFVIDKIEVQAKKIFEEIKKRLEKELEIYSEDIKQSVWKSNERLNAFIKEMIKKTDENIERSKAYIVSFIKEQNIEIQESKNLLVDFVERKDTQQPPAKAGGLCFTD